MVFVFQISNVGCSLNCFHLNKARISLAGDTLVGVNAYQLPAGFSVNPFCVVVHLILIAVKLFVLFGGYPAVSGYPLGNALRAVRIHRLYGRGDGYPAVSKVSYSSEAYSNILFFSVSFSIVGLSSSRPISFFNRMTSTGGSVGVGSPRRMFGLAMR